MQRVAAVYSSFLDFLKALGGIIIFAVFVLIVYGVFARIIGLQPWIYSTVLVEYGLLWFTMLSAPWLARNKRHVFVDAITQLLPGSIQRVVAKFVYLVCTIVSFGIAYNSFVMLLNSIAAGQLDTRAVDMPEWSLLGPIPLCFLLVGIEFLRFLLGFDSMYTSRTDADSRESV